jgi:hypothetical protein
MIAVFTLLRLWSRKAAGIVWFRTPTSSRFRVDDFQFRIPPYVTGTPRRDVSSLQFCQYLKDSLILLKN